jgi:hypothetical protein
MILEALFWSKKISANVFSMPNGNLFRIQHGDALAMGNPKKAHLMDLGFDETSPFQFRACCSIAPSSNQNVICL